MLSATPSRQWHADLLIAGKDGVVLGVLTAWILLLGYLLGLGLAFVDDLTTPGYFTRQGLIITALFGRFAVMVLAALLAVRDTTWGTWGLRLSAETRLGLGGARVVLVALVSTALVCLSWVCGAVMDAVNGLLVVPGWWELVQLAATAGIVTFWGILGFAVASATRSLSLGSAGLIAYVLLEMWAEARLPAAVLAVLPQWNAGVVASVVFPLNEAGVGPVAVHSGALAQGLVGMAAYLLIALAVCRWALQRQEY